MKHGTLTCCSNATLIRSTGEKRGRKWEEMELAPVSTGKEGNTHRVATRRRSSVVSLHVLVPRSLRAQLRREARGGVRAETCRNSTSSHQISLPCCISSQQVRASIQSIHNGGAIHLIHSYNVKLSVARAWSEQSRVIKILLRLL